MGEETKITETLKANGYSVAFVSRHVKVPVESETMDNQTPKVFACDTILHQGVVQMCL